VSLLVMRSSQGDGVCGQRCGVACVLYVGDLAALRPPMADRLTLM
jgi:hypothetical protein